MEVLFIFPDGDCTCKIDLDVIPRVGDGISVGALSEPDFISDDERKKFIEKEYSLREWKVEDVSWCINPVNSYVLVSLAEEQGPGAEKIKDHKRILQKLVS